MTPITRFLRWTRSDINLLLLLGTVGLIVWPMTMGSAYELRVFTIVGIYAILALGYQFIFGHAGALALTQGCFFGVGAYVTGILSTRYGLGAEYTLILSAVVPVVLAAIIAAPVLRLESHYFALATLGIGQVMLLIAVAWQDVTGGSNGLSGIPGLTFFGAVVPKGYGLLIAVWVFVALGAWSSRRITRGLYGAALNIARENQIAAQAIGVDTASLRFATFLLSALFAGVAGALYAHSIRVVSIETLEFPVMVACLTIAVVGGRTHIAGAILGAILIINLPEWFRGLEKYYLIAYGATLLLMIIAAPDGLIGMVQSLRAKMFPEKPEDKALPPVPSASAEAATLSRTSVAPGAPLLEIKGIGKRFGGLVALDGVSLTVNAGQIFGLIGPNGSGKTTLLNTVSGIYRPNTGHVVLEGKDVTQSPSYGIARSGVARTFQNINLVDEMSVVDNVAVARFGAERASLTKAFFTNRMDAAWERARSHAMDLLVALGIDGVALQPAGGLAYGIKRKVEIARALALEPSLLLLDEPAAGLNESEQLDLAQRLRTFANRGLSVLVIEHNMPFLLPLVDHLACLDRGVVIASGTADEVRSNPRVISAYLGAPSEPASGLVAA